MSKEDQEYYKATTLREIKLVSRNFTLPVYESGVADTDKFSYELSIGALFGEPETITKDIRVRIITEDGSRNLLADYHVLFFFHISPLKNFLDKSDTSKLHPDMNYWLNNVVLATTRGILFADLRGTFLDKVLLPLTSPEWLKEA